MKWTYSSIAEQLSQMYTLCMYRICLSCINEIFVFGTGLNLFMQSMWLLIFDGLTELHNIQKIPHARTHILNGKPNIKTNSILHTQTIHILIVQSCSGRQIISKRSCLYAFIWDRLKNSYYMRFLFVGQPIREQKFRLKIVKCMSKTSVGNLNSE